MNEIVNYIIYEPWPWWVGGPLIGVFVLVLFLLERKQLGISSSFQYICAKISPYELQYFKDPQKVSWQFWFVIGLVLGGLALFYLNPIYQISVSQSTLSDLNELGIREQKGFVPTELYQFNLSSVFVLLFGGLAIGFGARYANGCTAGHAIMGCAQLSVASIVSTVFFFVGGLLATYFILPLIF